MTASTKNRLKLISFVLLLTIVVFSIGFHLYNGKYAMAFLQSFSLVPVIINWKKLLAKWGMA